MPEVSRLDVTVTTPDGTCPATLHLPDGAAPAVIMYVDAAGVRDTFRQMADRLAAAGHVVLLPDVYYRHGAWRPFDAATVFADPQERGRLMGMARSVTAAMYASDAGAFLDFLAGRAEVSGRLVGTTGYCMGGRASLLVAGHHPERVGAAASFHGGRLADADNPDSPHLLADRIRAGVYVAAAQDDASFPPEQYERLEKAFAAAGVRATMETYPAAHGFAVPDNAVHDPTAEERHWAATTALFDRYLRGC
jgi:carboxymethylenebutenolidase